MLKQHKWKLLISSVLILLPALAGLILWDRLPEMLPMHWDINGQTDGWGSRALVVFGLPAVLLLLQWVGIWFTARDPGNKGQNKKVFGMVFWICPVISIFAAGTTYAVSSGQTVEMENLVPAVIGVLFVFVGNWMPKCKRNSTIGIKVKWALENDENWNATHRLGGRLWVIGGLAMVFSVFLPEAVMPYVVLVVVLSLIVIPMVYSYWFYRRQLQAGTASTDPVDRKQRLIHWIMVAAIVAFVSVLMFTGEIKVTFGDNPAMHVDATFYSDAVIGYERINHVEFREHCDPGSRVSGFGSARLLIGLFENEEFGSYTRYSYTRCRACVVLDVEGQTVVIGGKTIDATKQIYETLLKEME